MVSTRRRSKAAAAAQAPAPEAAPEVPETQEEEPLTPLPAEELVQAVKEEPPLVVTAPLEVAIPEDLIPTLTSLFPSDDLAHPSPDLILSLYRTLLGNATQLVRQTALEAQIEELTNAKNTADDAARKSNITARLFVEKVAGLEQVKNAALERAQRAEERISSLENEHVQLQTQLDEVKVAIESKDANAVDLQKRIEELEEAKRQMQEANNHLTEENENHKSAFATQETSLREANSTLSDKESKLAIAQEQLTEANAKIQALEEESGALRAELVGLKEEAAKQAEVWTKTQEDMATKQTQAEEENSRLTAQLSQIPQLQNEKAELLGNLQDAKTALESSEVNLAEVRKQLQGQEDAKQKLVGMSDELLEEIQHHKFTISNLEISLREINTKLIDRESKLASSEAKVGIASAKNQALEEEIGLLRLQVARLRAAATATMEEGIKSRRDLATKQAKIDDENACLFAQLSQLQATYSQLRASNDRLTTTHHQAISDLAELKAEHDSLQFQFRSSTAHWEDLRKTLDRRADELRELVQNMEGEWDREREQWRAETQLVQDDRDKDGEALAAAHERVQQLERALEEIGVGAPEDGQSIYSQSALLAIRAQKSGRTFSDIYTALIKTEEQLRREKEEHEALQAAFDSVVGQLAEKQPEIQQRAANYEKLESQLLDLTQRLSRALSAQDETAEELRRAKALAAEDKGTITGLRSSVIDLSRQVRALTREVAIRDDPLLVNETHPEFQVGWPDKDADEGSETVDEVISQAVVFTDLRQLQERNVLLLRMVRGLGHKLEAEENSWDDQEKEALREAEEAIEALQDQVERKNTLIQSLKEESDTWKQLATRQADGDALQGSKSQAVALVQSQLRESAFGTSGVHQSKRSAEDEEIRREEERRWREDLSNQMSNLREENTKLLREQGATVVDLARAKAQVEIVNDRLITAQDDIKRKQTENDELTKRASAIQASYSQMEARFMHTTTEYEKLEGRVNILNDEVFSLRAERESWKRYETTLQRQVDELATGKIDLNGTLHQMQSTLAGLQANHDSAVNRLKAELSDVQTQSEELVAKLETERQRMEAMQAEHEQSLKELQKINDNLSTELLSVKEKLQQAEADHDQFTTKVDEVQTELEAANERIAAYSQLEADAEITRKERLKVEADLGASRSEVVALRAQVASVQASTAASNTSNLDALDKQHVEELSRLQAELDEMKASQKKTVDEAVKVAVSKERADQTLRARNVINANVEKRLKKEAELEEAKAEIQKLKANTATPSVSATVPVGSIPNLDVLKAQHQSQIDTVKAEHTSQTDALKADYTSQLATLKLQHAEEVSKLRVELEESKASGNKSVEEAVKAAVTKERNEQFSRVRNVLNTNAEKHSKAEAELRTEIEKLKAQIASGSAPPAVDGTAEIDALKQQHALELSKLQTELTEIKASVTKAVDEAVKSALSIERAEQAKRLQTEAGVGDSEAIQVQASSVQTVDNSAEILALKQQHAEELSKLQKELEEAKDSTAKATEEAVKSAISKERSEHVTRVKTLIKTKVDAAVDAAKAATTEELQKLHAPELQALHAKLESLEKEHQKRLELNSNATKTWKDSVANLRKLLIVCNELLAQHGLPVPPEIQKEAQRAMAQQAQRNGASAQNGTTVPPTAPVIPAVSLPNVAPPHPASLPVRPTVAPPTVPALANPEGQQLTPTGRFSRPGRPSGGGLSFAAAVAAATQNQFAVPIASVQIPTSANGPGSGLKRAREGEEPELAPRAGAGAGQPKRQRLIRNRPAHQQQQQQEQEQQL